MNLNDRPCFTEERFIFNDSSTLKSQPPMHKTLGFGSPGNGFCLNFNFSCLTFGPH